VTSETNGERAGGGTHAPGDAAPEAEDRGARPEETSAQGADEGREPAGRATPQETHPDGQPPGEGPTREELEEKASLADEYLRHLRRLQADFENYRRRVRAETEELAGRAAERLIVRILPVIDHLEMAVGTDAGRGGLDALRTGVEMTLRQLTSILEDEGVSVISAEGVRFDPAEHEAVERVETTEHEEGTVLEELRRGYRIGSRVVRPAMVRVAVAPGNAGSTEDEGPSEKEGGS